MCGLGEEIQFVFDKSEPKERLLELKHKYDFDNRDGLNLIMTGKDMYEILVEDDERLIRQLEKKLNIDLSILDYWNYADVDENKDYIKLDLLLSKLIELKSKIENNPNFYKEITYGFNIEVDYLKNTLIKDVDYLIERLNFNIQNGATRVTFKTL